MAELMAREFGCSGCGNVYAVETARGPLPVLCDSCKVAQGVKIQGKGRTLFVRRGTHPSVGVPGVGARPANLRGPLVKPSTPPAGRSGVSDSPASTPFNSTATTAPLPSKPRPAVATAPVGPATDSPPAGPGTLERMLIDELDNLPMALRDHGHDGTLRAVALTVARMADQQDDFKLKMSAIKEYRSILGQLTAAGPAAGAAPAVVEDEPEGQFGRCAPELTGEVDLGECVPRWATRRRLERPTWGPYFGRVAAAMGRPFMPWQQHCADILGEVDHRGQRCYSQMVITVPRQSGKTTLMLSIVVGRVEAGKPWGGRQVMLYAAQTQLDATRKFNLDYLPELRGSEATKGTFVSKITGGVPTVTFNCNESSFAPTTTGPKAGHGNVLDLGIIDEAFSQPDDSVEGAWRPAMITRSMSQLLIPSTAGDATSTYFRGKVVAGRIAADEDSGYGTAYVEYSADEKAEGFDPGDEELWRRVMPALGHTQPIEALRQIYADFVREGKLSTWLRAFLNIWVDRRSDPVFAPGTWESAHRTDVQRRSRPVLALDVALRGAAGTIVMGAMGLDGEGIARPMVRVIDYRPGTDWMVERVLELREHYDVAAIVIDNVGPVRELVDALQNAYIDLEVTNSHDMAGACGAFKSAVETGTVTHHGDAALELAVAGAETRVLGDAWAWTRRKSAEETSTDISPLVAATLAYWGQVRFGDDLDHDMSGSFG